MSSLKAICCGLVLVQGLSGCKSEVEKTSPAEIPVSTQVLLGHSGTSRLQKCPDGFSGYPHCGQEHTYWSPPKASPVREMGDSIFSRVFLEEKIDDSTRILLIEDMPAFFDCNACAPMVSAVKYGLKSQSIQWRAQLGPMGGDGKIPDEFKIVRDRRGNSYLRHTWSDMHQGILRSGIEFTPLFPSSKGLRIDLEGSNEGACIPEENNCYSYKYSLADGDVLPDTLSLKGEGTRLSPEGGLEQAKDTLVPIRAGNGP